MSFLDKLRLLTGDPAAPQRKRKTTHVSGTVEFLETSNLIAILIFIATVAAIVVISTVGVSNQNLPVLTNQIAQTRIAASDTFGYESALQTQAARAQIRERTPRVHRLDLAPLEQFETHARELLAALDQIEALYPPTAITRARAIVQATEHFNTKGPYHITAEDLTRILAVGSTPLRQALTENALVTLRELQQEGIHDDPLATSSNPGAVTIYKITQPDGSLSQRPIHPIEEALTLLRINLAAEGIPREISQAFFRLFRHGLAPNLLFDAAASERLQQQALRDLRPVTVRVERGQTIIEPGTRVTPDQFEMLEAQRNHLLTSGATAREDDTRYLNRVLLVLAMVLASVLYIRIEDPETLQSNGRLALLALVVIFNLGLVRLTFWLTDLPFFIKDSAASALLPYLAPTALAPLILAILIDAGSAIFMALLISVFTSLIYGQRLDILVFTLFASIVGIFASRQIRRRSRLIRAASLGGLTAAFLAVLLGLIDRLPYEIIATQAGTALATGVFTGLIVVLLLPILESLFRRTTDITLFELTDYNHPLLRRLQMEAPGTYHHSLVVAQLAENAAHAIGAHALLARVCALYHDIGKTPKSAYYTENQHDRPNPHDESTPSLSALIIKAHVKDGVDLALKHKLPRPVIDVIRQHHGTTLIRYFFQRAINSQIAQESAKPFPAPGLDPAKVCETTYRYDGPKPQFKESAIIHLADTLEAASRSLKKVTPQHLGELIDNIVLERLHDGQLDESPLTLEELSKVKTSFTFTLLNMLHSRVSYPTDTPPPNPLPTGATML